MLIQVDVEAYYEWEPAPADCKPTEEELLALKYKPDGDGGWTEKVLVERESHTAINIPESEFLDAEMAARAKGKGFNRSMFAAWYVDEIVMRHHAPHTHFKKIHVHDDPALETLMNQLLVQTDGPRPPTPPSVGPTIRVAGGGGKVGGSGAGSSGSKKARPAQRRAGKASGKKRSRPVERRISMSCGAYSHFMSEVRDSEGRIKHRGVHRHNLTTDTASGYTNRRDWQAKAMGGGLGAYFGATAVGSATATSATSLTNSGASFPTTNQGLAGYIVAAGPRGTSSSGEVMVFAVIVSNTATVLTVDQWYNPATGAAGTTPNATCTYCIIPGQMPAMMLALTSDAVAPSSADTTLASEATTNGFARAIGTWAHTAAATTYTLQKLFTAAGSLTVNKEAVFGAINTTGGGVMPFESAEPTPPAMLSGDTLTQTVTITIN